jgi:hypothetical protein
VQDLGEEEEEDVFVVVVGQDVGEGVVVDGGGVIVSGMRCGR